MIYIFLFILFSICSLLDIYYSNRRIKNIIFISLAVILILIGGFRWQTGTDWSTYRLFFTFFNTLKQFLIGGYEPGFAVLNYIIKSLFSHYTFMLLTMCFLTITFYFKFFSNFEFKFIAVLAFLSYYIGGIFATRQTLAIGITLISSIYILNSNKKYFYYYLLLACTFHFTAIVFLPAYKIFHSRISIKTMTIILMFSILIGFNTWIIEYILNLIYQVLNSIGLSLVSWRLNNYLKEDALTPGNPIVQMTLAFSKRLLLLPLFVFLSHKIILRYNYFNGFLKLWIFGNILYFLLNNTLTVFNRLTLYFVIYELILIPMCIYAFNRKSRVIVYFILILYFGLRFYLSLQTYWTEYYPYYSVFHDSYRY